MPLLAQQTHDTNVEEYLLGERKSETKHEYVQGQIHAMAGAKVNHNRIVRNISSLLWDILKNHPCEPLTSDMLLKTSDDSYRYPDVMVVCEDDPSDDDYVREKPILIIEVLSQSTRKKDKGEKRLEYLALPSLQEYVLIEQDFAEVEIQRKREDWRASYYFLGQTVVLESINATLPVEAIYQRVNNDDVQAFLQG